MSAFDSTPADIERRADEPIDAERMTADGCANDVDDCIHRPHLVKVDGFDWHIVDPGFSFAEKLECSNGHRSRGSRNVRLADDVLDC